MNRFLRKLPEVEQMLLSRKKQRALDEMLICVDAATNYAAKPEQQIALDNLLALKNVLANPPLDRQPDWSEVAARWLLFRRESSRDPAKQLALLLANLPAFAQALEHGCIVVLEKARVRVRTLPISFGN